MGFEHCRTEWGAGRAVGPGDSPWVQGGHDLEEGRL